MESKLELKSTTTTIEDKNVPAAASDSGDDDDSNSSSNAGSDVNNSTVNKTTTTTTTTTVVTNNNSNKNVTTTTKGTSLTNLNYYDNGKGKSFKDRSAIPYSFYIVFITIIGLHYSCNIYTNIDIVVNSYIDSMKSSWSTLLQLLQYTQSVLLNSISISTETTGSATTTTSTSTKEIIQVLVICCLSLLLVYIFFIAPFRAGFWTGKRTKKATLHRYMGLFYLITYVAAWIEYFTNYNPNSYLCHIIACNGIIQAISAYISFKVLPELSDPGYYSDKAVLSRVFIHENIYFTLLSVWGSIYYIHDARTLLQNNTIGKLIEHIYIFYPYILIRPWFPLTSFSNAGTTYNGRSLQYKTFYKYGTLSVKIFYLWAKYFFGFFINYSVYLNLLSTNEWKLLHGMILLNTGTVSISVFLHTLRFKKVLPPILTFSVYLLQIYLSFLAIPTAISMFTSHPNLCVLCIAGLLLNMTRNRYIHGLWCFSCYFLLDHTSIKW